jgi:hypothetical protein
MQLPSRELGRVIRLAISVRLARGGEVVTVTDLTVALTWPDGKEQPRLTGVSYRGLGARRALSRAHTCPRAEHSPMTTRRHLATALATVGYPAVNLMLARYEPGDDHPAQVTSFFSANMGTEDEQTAIELL